MILDKESGERAGWKRDQWYVLGGLVVLSVLATLALLEAGVRLFVKVPPSLVIENLNKPGENDFTEYGDFSVRDDGTIVSEKLPGGFFLYSHTGTRLKKNARGLVRHHALSQTDIEIRTNSLGFRHRDMGLKQPGELRILVLGDSITFGDFVSQDQTYPAVMEQSLRRTFPGRRLEVINAGIGAVDLQNEFALLMEAGLSVKPDIVLVGLYLNDAHESPLLKVVRLPAWLTFSHLARLVLAKIDTLRALYKEYQWEHQLPDDRKAARERFARTHPIKATNEWDTEEGFNWEIHNAFQDWGYAWDEGAWQKMLPIVDMMRTVSRDAGFKLVFVFFPVRPQIMSKILRNEPQQRFVAEMRQRRLPYLDLLPALRDKYARDGQDMLYDHCHYKPEGYAFIGEALARFIVPYLDWEHGAAPGQ
ncbi:MAG: hypothetical protein KBB26_00530 [Candidatus Omnitrophica bacterium]|nr:hypothetical protein [Candidatus Omnitrophota bacterium]